MMAHPRRRRALRTAAWIFLACWAAGLAALGWLAVTRAVSSGPGAAATGTAPASSLLTASPVPTPLPSSTATAIAVVPTASPTSTASGPATPAPTPSAPPHDPAVVREVRVLPGTEPDVTASPFRAGLVAVVSQNVSSASCARPAVTVSTDAGATWSTPTYPWNGCQDKHAVLAWGPGPDPGSSRLWAVNAIGVTGGLALSVTTSDDLGRTWSKPYVSRSTPPWVGCFPTIAVDNSPASPDFGTVYVAYNWLAVAPTGGAYVSFYEGDMAAWSAANMWNIGKPSNTGRAGYAISTIDYSASGILSATAPTWVTGVRVSTSPIFDPECQSELAVDPEGGVWLALSDRPAIGDGVVKVGHSTDGGRTWAWSNLGVAGTEGFKASLAISGRTVFVGWHAMEKSGTIRTYFTTTVDGGLYFAPVSPVSASSFRMPSIVNGTGLREAASAASGLVYYAWGDARDGLAIYLAVVEL
jgi:hypothetical protein